jgi:hypothetical protein
MVRKPSTWSSSCRPGQAVGWDSSGGPLPRSAPPDVSACVSLMASPGENRAQVLSRTEAHPCQPKRASHLSSRPPGRRARRASRSSATGRRRPEVSSAAIAVSSNTSVCTWLLPKLRNRGRGAARRPAASWLSPARKSRSPRAPALPGSSPAPTPVHNAGRVTEGHGVDDTEDHRSYLQERRSHSSPMSGFHVSP